MFSQYTDKLFSPSGLYDGVSLLITNVISIDENKGQNKDETLTAFMCEKSVHS